MGQMIESLLATRSTLLKQHADCALVVEQMSALSVSVASVSAAPYSKKRRQMSFDEDDGCDLGRGDDIDFMDEEPIVYRSCGSDEAAETIAEPNEGTGALARQVELLTQIVGQLEQADEWGTGKATASMARLTALNTELAAI